MEQKQRRVGRPRGRVENVNLTLRLPKAAIDRLAELAIKREVTINQMARIIVLRGLNQDYSLGTAMSVGEVAKEVLKNMK